MSCKNSCISPAKPFTEKNLLFSNSSTNNNGFYGEKNKLDTKSTSKNFLYKMIFKNLKKYSITKKQYNVFIINSIIFDQRIHKVAVFKNSLLWDESSEFLKRLYKKKESLERIPKISDYYENYTLFPPVYFGLGGLIVITMNAWTKKKKDYLEYIEDHEEEKKNSKLKDSFEPLINNSSLNNINSSKSLLSKNTLELSKLECETKKNSDNKIKLSATKNNKFINNRNKDKIENISILDIINDLSSDYSVIINNEINNTNKKINVNKNEEKIKKISNNNTSKIKKKRLKNSKKINKSINKIKININNTAKKINLKSIQYSPKKYVKISLNKKNNKILLKSKNPNILFRNKNNNLPIPSTKNSHRKILNTDNLIISNIQSKDISKGTIRVNTITSFIREKKKISNNNQLIQNSEKYKSGSLKKSTFHFIRKNTDKYFVFNNKKQYISTINKGNTINSHEKIYYRIIKNQNNVLKKKKYIQIKKEPFLNINNLNNSINQIKQSSYRNQVPRNYMNYVQEMTSNSTNKRILMPKVPKINFDVFSTKKMKDIVDGNSKNSFLEDPFIYKLSQFDKKKVISITTANSRSKIKNVNLNEFNSISGNSNINLNNSKNKLKIANHRNLVLSKLNSKNNIIYNKKRKIMGDNSERNKSINSSLIPKTSDNSLHFSVSNKKINNWKNGNKKNNQKNINLNLNLNIHFNIGLENKNKGRKILFNNTIINQMQDKMNKNSKSSKINKSKDRKFNYQYPLTSRENNFRLGNLIDMNKVEYTLLKKA